MGWPGAVRCTSDFRRELFYFECQRRVLIEGRVTDPSQTNTVILLASKMVRAFAANGVAGRDGSGPRSLSTG